MTDSYLRVKRWRALNKIKTVVNKQSLRNEIFNDCVSEVNNPSDSERGNLETLKSDFDCGNNSDSDSNNNSDSDSNNNSDSDRNNNSDSDNNYNSDFDSSSNSTGNNNNDNRLPDQALNSSSQHNNEEVKTKQTLSDKLRCWTLDNLNILTLNVVTQLLTILREEGHEKLPKTSQQLLKTKHCRPMKSVLSKRETAGSYIYIGIKNVLQQIISPDIYTEKTISVQLHIDGISIYSSSLIPFDDVEKFIAFDESLKNNEEKKKALIDIFQMVSAGCNKCEDDVYKIMGKIIKKEVQLQYSGAGKIIKGLRKKSFKETETFNALERFLTAKYHASKEKPKVLTAVSTFLSGAKDRDGGRAQRNKNTQISED